MIYKDDLLKLTKKASIYSRIPTKLEVVENSDEHYCQIINNHATIYLGENSPYKYREKLHIEGYYLFLEGLMYHELASILYSNDRLFMHCLDIAREAQMKTNRAGRDYLDKNITVKELKNVIYDFVYYTNLPLLLKAIEDGAIENSLGMEHPETWDALMFARNHIVVSFMEEKKDVNQVKFMMDKIIKEIMAICTYGYRHHLYNSIQFLPTYLPDAFENIRKLAIRGRLQSTSTSQRLDIAKEILDLCEPIMKETVMEIFDTIRQSNNFSGIDTGLFNSMQSEIAINFEKNEGNSEKPEHTKSKYELDLSEEDFRRIEQMENQEEKDQQHRFLQEILQREKERNEKKEEELEKRITKRSVDHLIIDAPLQRTSPTNYGRLAMHTLNQSIQRSNKMARLLKREIMYASKNQVKHKLEYGRKLDQLNLYRATLDGRVFYERKEGHKKDLCVYILVDVSESMSGDKIVNTMKGCYEVARVLQTLKIPFCISCHKAVVDKVQMTEIISFKQCMKRTLLDRIFYMHVSGGTHEEIALEKALQILSKNKQGRKGFVFVLSDGDTPGVERIHNLTRVYKKEKDIDVIGIGIQTAPMIETTYPHGMFIQDINALPEILVAKIREIAL